MIELGCNYSPQLITLLKSGKVDMEWIKVSRWDNYQDECKDAFQYKPILLHIYPHAGKGNFDKVDWEQINYYITEYKSPHIAIHLSSPPSDWNRPVWDYEVIERMINNIKMWSNNVKVPLLIENVPYFGFKETLRCATDPEVIKEICEQTQVGLLLDIAHARIASCYRQETITDYIRKLPLSVVEEIHVNAPGIDPEVGYFRDLHSEMQEIDYLLLDEVLSLSSPKIVTIEYGGTGDRAQKRTNIDAIEKQIKSLRRIIQ